LAALLLAFSRFDVWWAQEIRMYSLAAALALASTWLTLRLLHGRASQRDWLGYVLTTASGLLTLYLLVIVPIVQSLYVAWRWFRQQIELRRARQWIVAQAIVGAIIAPWLLFALTQMRTWSAATPFDARLFLQLIVTLLALGQSQNLDAAAGAVALIWTLLAIGLAVGAWRGGLKEARGLGLIVLMLALPPLAVYALSQPRAFFYVPPVQARYLVPLAWSFYLLLAWSLWSWARRHRLVTIALTVLVLGVFATSLADYYAGRYLSDDYKSVASTLRAYRQPDDVVLLHTDAEWPSFAYHYPDQWNAFSGTGTFTPDSGEGLVKPALGQAQGVWLVVNDDALRADPRQYVEGWLAGRAAARQEFRYGSRRLVLFALTAERAAHLNRLVGAVPRSRHIALADGLELVGYEQPLHRVRTGDEFRAAFYWQADTRQEVQVVLMDDRGRAVHAGRMSIESARGATTRTEYSAVLGPDIPSGAYRLALPGLSHVGLGRIEVIPASLPAAAPVGEIQHPYRAEFEGGIVLLGYDLSPGPHQRGEQIRVTLYWQATTPVLERYKVFTHLLGKMYNAATGNFLWGQHDGEPVDGTYSTTLWRAGVVIADTHSIPIASAAPTGDYVLEAGLYQPATGQRLNIVGPRGKAAADHIELTTIWVQ